MVTPRPEVTTGPTLAVTCRHCGSELDADSPACPHCGSDVQFVENATLGWPSAWPAAWRAFTTWRLSSGRSLSTLVAFALGCGCLVASAVTSWVFKATTLTDWQAVQLWRIEWLLTAIAMFLVGVLLKKK